MRKLEITYEHSYAQNFKADETELLSKVRENIADSANVYVILDDAVALGKYKDGHIQIGLNRTVHTLDTCKYLKELRVFNETCEFRAIRVDGTFRCRYRIDGPQENAKQLAILKETHKLWGAARQGEDANGWSLLQSDRGTQLYYPGVVQAHGERGVVVRSYIEFYKHRPAASPDDDCGGNLYKFVDERLVEFVNWPPESGNKEEASNGMA